MPVSRLGWKSARFRLTLVFITCYLRIPQVSEGQARVSQGGKKMRQNLFTIVTRVLAVLAIAVFLHGPLAAQTASLSGVVTDATGAVVPSTAITATHLQRNLSYKAVS